MKNLTLILIAALFIQQISLSQFNLTGTIYDSLSVRPVESARVELFGTDKFTYTNNDGLYLFENLTVGFYTVKVSKEEYITSINTVQFATNPAPFNIFLQPKNYRTDTIDVNAVYFRKTDDINTSYMNVEYDEIRKSPGALEDVVRYFTNSPGVSMGNDINNEIIIRGGSPVENLTLIDGLTVQNPNHYGAPGSTNGVLSYINLKLVKDVDFFSGGFPPVYGDRLSGVMDIKFREGNRKKHIRDLNISATGFGAFLEGPINKKSSYMLSVRRSYYELIEDLLESALIPEYWDVNAKVSYDFSSSDKISLTGLFATDLAKPLKEGDYMYDTVNVKMLSTGVNYNKSGEGFNISLVGGYLWNFYKVNYQDFVLDINDNEISFKQELNYFINKRFTLNIFSGTRYFFSDYNVKHGPGFNASNYYTPAVSFNDTVNTFKFSAGINLTSYFFKKRLVVNTGFRIDAFNLINDKFAFSPRAGFSYKLTPITTINANAGIYYQAPEMLWVLVDPENKNLKYIRVDEIVLGFEHLFSFDTKISIEPYLKQYYNYPVSVYDPNYIFINSGVEIYPNFLDKALSAGKGYYLGVDVTLQKKNSGFGLYGTVAYSFSRSRFLALAGDIQPAEFDYGHQLTAITGWKFKFGLSLSARFKFAKGRPYTPYDYEKTMNSNRGIYDKTQYNRHNMPDYARFDLRVDQQFNFGKAKLIAYIELINVFNRVNYYNYYWSSYYKILKSNLQFPRVPIIGLSFLF